MTELQTISIFLGLAYTAYFVISGLLWYFIFSLLQRVKNQALSKTARLLAYRTVMGRLIGIPLVISSLTLSLSFIFHFLNDFILFSTLILATIPYIFIFTIYRTTIIELTEDIRRESPRLGKIVQFFYGFSSFKEMWYLFLVLILGMALMIIIIWFLISKDII